MDVGKGGCQEVKLKNKVGLMTASGSGIGRAIARRLAREGARLVVNDINAEGGRRTVEMIRDAGGEAVFFEADVSDAVKMEEMVEFTTTSYGRLDILLNNAAHLDFSGSRPLAEVSVEAWDKAIAVGLRSYFLGCKFAIPVMVNNGGGVIINISSVAGLTAFHWYSAYNCLKAGIINLTKNVVLDYGSQNIRSVCICPGTVKTELLYQNFPEPDHPFRKLRERMIPMEKLGEPDEIANVALFLASDEASYVNGAVIAVDGGMSAGRYIHNWKSIFSEAIGNKMQ